MVLTRADVGHRVVVRRLLPGEVGPSGGPALTDVIGMLESWERAELVVRRTDDTLVRIPTELVVAAKRVPPAPTRRPR
ncbi:MAG: hypothetical protein ACRDO2_05575 [Nocardioidaceae bacterium]